MRRILIAAVTAGVLSVGGLAGTANAAEHRGHESRGREVHEHAYYRDHGHRFSGGWYYAGRDHHHWTRTVWDPAYHRYQYWDPYLGVWFYWAPAYDAYYPITYICP